MTESFIESTLCREDTVFEVPLRPFCLEDFVGQDPIKERLGVMLGAAKKRNEPMCHSLFCGPPGLGKTTLANILAKSMGTTLATTSGPVLEKPGDLAGVLTHLQRGDVLFIDEIHRLNRAVEETLYSAMEYFCLDLVIDSGANARTVQVKLNPFTLVGATTKAGLLTSPLRSRFTFSCRLEYYEPEVLEKIVVRTGKIMSVAVDSGSAAEIARRSRGTPRIANNLLRWVRDYVQERAANQFSFQTVCAALDMLSIDQKGLDEMDRKILSVLIDHYNGGPVGVNTLAVAVGEEASTIEEIYEPFLVLQGFIKRTPRGREASSLAYQHLGR